MSASLASQFHTRGAAVFLRLDHPAQPLPGAGWRMVPAWIIIVTAVMVAASITSVLLIDLGRRRPAGLPTSAARA